MNTGSYFGRVKIGGKTFREGLDTDVFTTAKLWVARLKKETAQNYAAPLLARLKSQLNLCGSVAVELCQHKGE